MEDNLCAAIEEIERGIAHLEQMMSDDAFLHGTRTAESIRMNTPEASASYIPKHVKRVMVIICENLIHYHLTQAEPWMNCPEYATAAKGKEFLSTFIKNVKEKIDAARAA